MSVTSTIPAPIIQMGLVEKIVDTVQNQPHVQQLVAQETAKQTLKEQDGRVKEVDAPEHGKKIRDREPGQKRQEQRQASGKKDAPTQDGDDADTAGGQTNPWSGHIVNIKI